MRVLFFSCEITAQFYDLFSVIKIKVNLYFNIGFTVTYIFTAFMILYRLYYIYVSQDMSFQKKIIIVPYLMHKRPYWFALISRIYTLFILLFLFLSFISFTLVLLFVLFKSNDIALFFTSCPDKLRFVCYVFFSIKCNVP